VKKRGGAYRGTLKARISKLYGGDVTVSKARKLKSRKNATARDKQLANWFINMQTADKSPIKKDPKTGTGKKPKGSSRRLYTDENPKDTVSIKFATPADARASVRKVLNSGKSYARKMQILTVGEQRSRYSKTPKREQQSIFKGGKIKLKKSRKNV
jgi:hypothetical protein